LFECSQAKSKSFYLLSFSLHLFLWLQKTQLILVQLFVVKSEFNIRTRLDDKFECKNPE